MPEWNGRMCNNFFQIAAILSFAKDNNHIPFFPDWSYNQFLKKSIPLKPNNLPAWNNLEYSFFYRETKFEYQPINLIRISDMQGNIAKIWGYYQSKKYWQNNSDYIHDIFTLNQSCHNIVDNKFNGLVYNKGIPCSIHVRRTDYLTLQQTFYILDKDYYNKAIESLGDKKDYLFLIFSDDIQYCKELFKDLPNKVFIENNIDIIDLFLMSKCEVNIIANSSFSWWGAELNKNQSKKVFAPSEWFKKESGLNTIDLYNPEWVDI